MRKTPKLASNHTNKFIGINFESRNCYIGELRILNLSLSSRVREVRRAIESRIAKNRIKSPRGISFLFVFRAGRARERVPGASAAVLPFRRRSRRPKVHAGAVLGLAAETVERRDELVQRAGGRDEFGAVRGRHVARVPHQPDTRVAQGKRSAGRRGWQRQTVPGAAVGFHIVPGTLPGAAQVHVRHSRPEGRPGGVVPEGRLEEHEHYVPDDRLASGRRTVLGAHQRHAGQRSDTGAVCRRRDRQHHTGRRSGGSTVSRDLAQFLSPCPLNRLFGFSGESERFARNQRERLGVFHQQSAVFDQNRFVLLAGGQHVEGPSPEIPGFGHLHFDQLVLRVAQRSAGIRVVPIPQRLVRTLGQTQETRVAFHGSRTQFRQQHVGKVLGQRPSIQLHDAQIVFGANQFVHETVGF